ncbi:hypothetical protein JD844_021327 [Phrynosoma platyrhinos]|uniref:Myb/SANT-like DNA-binding domain-containing protein n=1 Tax=Phrynosoma platyrhinos TaxID=52577 RepID=A0ABQ7STR8_PHRPL|nr:hypothetical protein JD844_021327 [Phrynosoma platyrhinos]
MAEDSPKRRKANFNEAETEVLIEQVLRHEQVLFAAGPGRASPGQKRKVWELIRHKILEYVNGESNIFLHSIIGFADDPGPSHQTCAEKVHLKEEIVVKVVEPEESSEDMAVVPPSQEQLPFLRVQNGSPCGKVKAKTKTQLQTNPNEITEEDLLHIQQNQLDVIQSGFESINHNLRLLQQGMQDLNNSLSVMAHTLVAIKNVYVKNNAGPVTFATVTTQTTAGYLSPGSPLAEDRVRVPVAGGSSRSSSCSSSSMSQEPGPSEFPRPPHRSIKKEHPNGCYYFCFADV